MELPASLHRDLTAYAGILGREARLSRRPTPFASSLPMLERFIASGSRGFAQQRGGQKDSPQPVVDDCRAAADRDIERARLRRRRQAGLSFRGDHTAQNGRTSSGKLPIDADSGNLGRRSASLVADEALPDRQQAIGDCPSPRIGCGFLGDAQDRRGVGPNGRGFPIQGRRHLQ